MKRGVIAKKPYRVYELTLDDFLTHASPRMQVDLLDLSDRVKGWHSNYGWLRDVGVEAVRAHPVTDTRGVLGSISGMLRLSLYRSISSVAPPTSGSGTSAAVSALPTP